MSNHLISATWVLPVSRGPLHDGAVLVEDEHVVAVGPQAELDAIAPPGTKRHHFEGATVMPGLVNAHTHLALTSLAGAIPPMPFTEWVSQVVSITHSWNAEDYAASAERGVQQSLDAGVAAVGDIAYSPAEITICSRAGLAGVFFAEVLGVPAAELDAALARMDFSDIPAPEGLSRVLLGLSPHSPYTSGPELLRAVHARAESLGLPFAIHIAESTAESELVACGTGPLAPVAQRVADGFEPVDVSPTAYLDQLGVLHGATLVHLGEASTADIALLANAGARGAVVCPRSNRYLGNRVANVPALLTHGVPVGIGTDSAASNENLDLMADVRALAAEHPSLAARTLIDIVTRQSAQAIGLEDRSGTLEPGSLADIAIFDIADDEPELGVVRHAGASSLVGLMTNGVWQRYSP